MKEIDKKAAKLRIMKALVGGHIETYGVRREIEVEREVMVSPGHKFDPTVEYVDREGIQRKGKFVPLPPVRKMHTFKYPQGVVPAEIAQWAGAVIDGFMEVLNIVEEAVGEVEPEQAHEIIAEMRETAGG